MPSDAEYDRIDQLVDTDPLALMHEHWYLMVEYERAMALLAEISKANSIDGDGGSESLWDEVDQFVRDHEK